MQHNSSGAESSTATEHVAASAEITMDMQAVVTEWSQRSTDDARELVHAAQIILTGNQQAVRLQTQLPIVCQPGCLVVSCLLTLA